jgi:inhibitor of KinA sporulation pathway (predicted exonuclease)
MREAVILDTEYTAWDGSAQRNWTAPGEFREIIQIGAIAVDAGTLNETAAFSIVVRPSLNPVLSGYITSLTGITQDRVDREGVALTEGVRQFLAFRAGRPLFSYGDDGWVIAKNLILTGHGAAWPAGLRTANIGRWFADQGLDVRNLNSGRLAAATGAAFDGRAHDALGDCRSILAAVKALAARGAANPF